MLCFVVLVGGFTDVGLVDAARAFVSGALGSVDAVSETLTRAVPLAIVGVGAALGLRAGVFNVGGESQMIMGAVAAVIVTGWVGGSAPVGVVWAVAAVARSPVARCGPSCRRCCGWREGSPRSCRPC